MSEEDYKLQLLARLRYEGGEPILSRDRTLTARIMPWIEPLMPMANQSYPDSDPVPVQAVIKQGCDPAEVALLGGTARVDIQRDGAQVASYPLRFAPELGPGMLVTEIPTGALEPRDYVAVFHLEYPDADKTTSDESLTQFQIFAGQVRPPTPTAVPPTAAPTPTAIPPTLAPTATVAPPLPPPPDERGRSPWLWLLPAGLLSAAGGVFFLWFRGRPSLGGFGLDGPTGPVPLGGRSVKLSDPNGNRLATLRPRATGSRTAPGVEFVVTELAPGIEGVSIGRTTYGVGETITPEAGDALAVGGETYVLRSAHEPGLYDSYSVPEVASRAGSAPRSLDLKQPVTSPRPSGGAPTTRSVPQTEPRPAASEPSEFGDDYDEYR
jgi:hypothetical protein